MKYSRYFIPSDYQQDFLIEITRVNLERWKPLAGVIIGIELTLLLILFLSLSVNTSFKFGWYAPMYVLMIVVTGLVWLRFGYLGRRLNEDSSHAKRINLILLGYLAFLMTWGAVISLMDQELYGNIIVFAVNMLVGSFMFFMNSKRIAFPQSIAFLVIMIGLPFFQTSRDILIGHYINIIIFTIFSWIIARTNYFSFVKDYLNQKSINEKTALLTQINSHLVSEIKTRERIQKELEAANEQLRAISSLDALTGIPNRRKLEESLKERWTTAVREPSPIAIMMIDIDLFKLYNDTYGHLAGDYCLQTVARVLSSCTRNDNDLVARYGGEEFLFVATGIGKEEALQLGEKIRTEIENLRLDHANSSIIPYVTASVGISWQTPTETGQFIEDLSRADQTMYQAKRAGRNRVIMAE